MVPSDFYAIPGTYALMIGIPWLFALLPMTWFGLLIGIAWFAGWGTEPDGVGATALAGDAATAVRVRDDYRPAAPAERREERVPVLPGLAHLRIVAANGTCRGGYKVGDVFTCTSSGEVRPPLCAAARLALRPLLVDMVAGKSDCPHQVSCPIYDHMLVFELNGGHATEASETPQHATAAA